MAKADSTGSRNATQSPERATKASAVRKVYRHATPDQLTCELPDLNIPAAKLFPRQWAALPTRAKVMHALAHQCSGLLVTHSDHVEFLPDLGDTMQGWLWVGEEATFRASGFFKASTNWRFLGWGAADTGEGLSVHLRRVTHGGKEMIYASHQRYGLIGQRSSTRFVAMADSDTRYQAFRALMLASVAGVDLSPWDGADGRGPVCINVPEGVAQVWKRCGLFRPLVKLVPQGGTVRVSEAIAVGMATDAMHWAKVTGSMTKGSRARQWVDFAEHIAAALRAARGADEAETGDEADDE